jgi:hypothetical protein
MLISITLCYLSNSQYLTFPVLFPDFVARRHWSRPDHDPSAAVEAQVIGDGDPCSREHLEAVHVRRRRFDQPRSLRIRSRSAEAGRSQRNVAASGRTHGVQVTYLFHLQVEDLDEFNKFN